MESRFFLIFLLSIQFQTTTLAAASGGHWNIQQQSIGVSAMHMQLLHNDRVVIFDRTDFGTSNLSLPAGRCRDDPNDQAVRHDCSAHSVEYDVAANTFRPLTVLTDTWCSSGTVSPDGNLVQTGGFNDGERTVRVFSPCDDGASCDWDEVSAQGLAVPRWYATNQILPDGRAFIVGGRRQFNYEFYPKGKGANPAPIRLPLLRQTHDPDQENNLYPFVHLNVDGNLFIFANNRAILFDYRNNAVVRTYPAMPGGDPRNYPSCGSSALLPLIEKPASGTPEAEAEVLVCGGAPKGSYIAVSTKNTFLGALATCGRIKITDRSPSWSVETMPTRRVMGDMVMLPTGKVLIVNGAASGTAGWEFGKDPVLSPVLYSPDSAAGARFEVQTSATTPRIYHSTAILLRDGRVLVGGSNPHISYVFSGVQYPTDLSLETYSPEYLSASYSNFRPKIIAPTSSSSSRALMIRYGKQFSLQFAVRSLVGKTVSVTMVAPSFTTHSVSMNQRLLVLGSSLGGPKNSSTYSVAATAPASGNYAPSGYYMVFVVNAGVPSEGIWVHVSE